MTIQIPTPNDFDFVECIDSHGWRSLLPFSWDGSSGVLERVEEFGHANIARLRLSGGQGFVTVDVIGAAPESDVIRRVRHILQLDLAMDQFHLFCAQHPSLKHIPARRQGRMLRSPTVFEDTLKVITTTNTTWSQTKGMVSRMVEAFGSKVAGDMEQRAFPRPERIAAMSLEEFSKCARLGYRNAAVYGIASDIAQEKLDLESLADPAIPSADLYKRLLQLPGVGPYAASCLMIYLGRYDRVNVDSWARMMVGKELGRPVSDKEAHAFFEPYGEWKALVYHFYKWREAAPDY